MMSREQNEQLSRIGPGTLMGKLLRRYWAPFLLAVGNPRAGLPAGQGQADGRDADRLPRQQGPRRPDRRILRPSRRLAVVRRERRLRHPLPLPRLEIRHHRAMHRSAVGAGGVGLPQEHQIEILPVHREGRHRLGLYGAAGIAAAAAGAGMDRRRARAALRLQAPAGMQLPAGDGRRHRFQPRLLAARLASSTRTRCSRARKANDYNDQGPHAAVRGRGIFRRPADRRAPQCRGRQILLAHHALDHALVHHHPAARRASARARTPGCRSTTRPAGPGASIIIPSAR